MRFFSGALHDTFEFTIAQVYQPLALTHPLLQSQLFVLGNYLVCSAAPTTKTGWSEGQNDTASAQNLYPRNPPASFILFVSSDLATTPCNNWHSSTLGHPFCTKIISTGPRRTNNNQPLPCYWPDGAASWMGACLSHQQDGSIRPEHWPVTIIGLLRQSTQPECNGRWHHQWLVPTFL